MVSAMRLNPRSSESSVEYRSLAERVCHDIAKCEIGAFISNRRRPVRIGAEERVVVTEDHAEKDFSHNPSANGSKLGSGNLQVFLDRDFQVSLGPTRFGKNVSPQWASAFECGKFREAGDGSQHVARIRLVHGLPDRDLAVVE